VIGRTGSDRAARRGNVSKAGDVTRSRISEIAMADDMTEPAKRDDFLINISISDDHEVAIWSKTLRVSKQRLAEAVQAVGPSATKVAAYLDEDAR
jgi:hypothetical protein